MDVVAKPERQADVPAGPEVADVSREKGRVEILRGADAKEPSEADGEGAVTREVEEQVERFRIQQAELGQRARLLRRRGQPVRVDERGDDEFVKKPAEGARDGEVEIVEELRAAAGLHPVLREAAVAVDRAGGDRGKEKEEGKILRERQRFHHAVVDAEDDIEGAKGDVGNAEEAEHRVGGDEGQPLREHEREQREAEREVESRARLPAEKTARHDALKRGIPEDDPDFAHLKPGPNGEVAAELHGEDAQRDEEHPPASPAVEQPQRPGQHGVEQQPEEGEIAEGNHPSISPSFRRSALPFAVMGNAST